MMMSNGFIKKVLYAVGANVLSLLTSLLTTLVVPKFLGVEVEQYGYLQIYMFYVGYLGFFHFGWCDGIFLRDGGKQYSDLDKPLYSAQLWLLTAMELGITAILVVIGLLSVKNGDYRFIWIMTALNILVLLPRTMLAYCLQTTNRIKEYASITTAGRLVYGLSILLTILFLNRDYKWFIIGDLFGKGIALFVSVWLCKDIVFTKPAPFRRGVSEGKENIAVGVKLLLANIASLLIVGIVRWGIQRQWDVATYGKISLTLNVSNLLLTFISAIALVLYPTLKRVNEGALLDVYGVLRNALMALLLGMLTLYYPARELMTLWLPQYADGLRYLAMLFPTCIYSAKMAMLIQTYLNVYRLEKQILKTDLLGVAIAVASTVITVFWLKSLTLAMLSIVLNQMFMCIFAECALARRIHIRLIRDIVYEAVMTLAFIVVNWFIGGWTGNTLYAIAYIAYIYIKRKEIKHTVACLRSAKKSEWEHNDGTDSR